jgi:hypothetical protein
LAVATVGNTSFGNVYRRPLSETAFMVSLFVTVAAMRRLSRSASLWHVVAAAASLAAVVLIRPAGIMLAGGFGMTALAAARRKETSWLRAITIALAVGLPAVFMQALWMKIDREHGIDQGTASYAELIRDPTMNLAEQLLEGVRLRIQETGRMLLPGMYKVYAKSELWLDPLLLIYAPLFTAVLWGWLRFVRQERDPYAWMFPFYLGLYVVWPFEQTTRFFTPLFPLLLGCLLKIAPSPRFPTLRAIGIGFCLVHLAVALGYWLFDERRAAMKLQAAAPELRRVVAAIPADEAAHVAVSDQLDYRWLWVQWLLERRVDIWDSGPPRPNVHLLICSEREPSPEGFAPLAIIEGYRVDRRSEHTSK